MTLFDANNIEIDRRKELEPLINKGRPTQCSVCGAPLRKEYHKSFMHIQAHFYRNTFNAYICTECLKTAYEMTKEDKEKEAKP